MKIMKMKFYQLMLFLTEGRTHTFIRHPRTWFLLQLDIAFQYKEQNRWNQPVLYRHLTFLIMALPLNPFIR